MRIAAWRYGLPIGSRADTTVGGGRLTEAALDAVSGYDVVVVGKASRGGQRMLREKGIPYEPASHNGLAGFDAALILTGPANALYSGYGDTYRLLDGFGGRAVYFQTDIALRFHFSPAGVKGQPPLPDPLRGGASFVIVTQAPERLLRRTRDKRSLYGSVPYTVVPCNADGEGAFRDWLEPSDTPRPELVYCGGDRPGRVAVLRRWFGARGAPPLHVYGRWSKASQARMPRGVSFRGPVTEAQVPGVLNQYKGTIFCTSKRFVLWDWLTRRFFENLAAGTPAIYLSPVQPSVQAGLRGAGSAVWLAQDPAELGIWHDTLDAQLRRVSVEQERAMCQPVLDAKGLPGIREAMATAFQGA